MNHGLRHPVSFAAIASATACALVPCEVSPIKLMKNVGNAVLLFVPSRYTSTSTQFVVPSGQFQSIVTVLAGGTTPQTEFSCAAATTESCTMPLVVDVGGLEVSS